MKPLPMLLLNVALVVVALVVYDQLRTEDVRPRESVLEGSAESEAVLARLAALERARAPTLQATGTDARVLARLAALEEALGPRAPSSDAPEDGGPVLTGRAPTAPLASADEPTDDEIRRFRKLRAAVQQQERMEKIAAHVDERLAKLPIKLSKRQRAKIHAAYSEFRPRIGQIWQQAKEEAQETMKAGGTVDRGEIVETTTTKIQQEFAGMIDGVVSSADAESISETLLAGGR